MLDPCMMAMDRVTLVNHQLSSRNVWNPFHFRWKHLLPQQISAERASVSIKLSCERKTIGPPNRMQWAAVKFDAGIDGGEGERPWGTRLKRTPGTSKCRSCNCEWSPALVKIFILNPCRINWVWQAARTSQILDTGMTLSYPSIPSLFAFDFISPWNRRK